MNGFEKRLWHDVVVAHLGQAGTVHSESVHAARACNLADEVVRLYRVVEASDGRLALVPVERLREIEWIGRQCPVCTGFQPCTTKFQGAGGWIGHSPGCWLGEACREETP